MIKEKVKLWPQWLISSLDNSKQDNKNNLPDKSFISSQTYLWRTLNIYDDILDDGQQIESLPQANFYFRNFLKIFYESKPPPYLKNKVEKLWQNLEKFHQAELKEGKIFWKNKKIHYHQSSSILKINNLANKSLVLAIMPIVLASHKNLCVNSTQANKLFNFFKYLLITKQLADDVKDWEEDLRAGKLTIATKLILDNLKNKKIKINQKNHIYQARIVFIKISAFTLGQKIIKTAQKARNIANELNIQTDSLILKKMLWPLEKQVLKTQKILAKKQVISML